MEHNLLIVERNKALRECYEKRIKNSGVNRKMISHKFAMQILGNCPAPRFYIGEKRAAMYVNAWYENKITHGSLLKQQMVEDLVHVFEEIRDENRDLQMKEIWYMVVEHPAKSFYMTQQSMAEVIFNYRKNGKRNTKES